MQGIQTDPEDLEQLRERIRRMSDPELLRYGQVAKYMCSSEANQGKPPLETYVVQLQEARKQWWKRHPTPPLSNSF